MATYLHTENWANLHANLIITVIGKKSISNWLISSFYLFLF